MKGNPPAVLGVPAKPIRSPGGDYRQNDLIALQSSRAVDGVPRGTVQRQVLFGARDEEGASLREAVEASEVHQPRASK